MPQPPAYIRGQNLIDYAAANPDNPYPSALVETEFNEIKETLDPTLANLALIQRDDGKLINGSVHQDSFSTAALALIASTWTPKGLWATATNYVVGDVVEESATGYVCATAHTSGTFATDHTAGKWTVLSPPASAFVLTLLNDVDASAFLTTLGFSTFVKTLVDDADASAFLTTLGITTFIKTLFDDTTAAAARATLGSTSVGDAVFVAASAAAARTAIDSPSNAEALLKTGGTVSGGLVGTSATFSAASFIGDTANTFNTLGLTINQGANTNELLSFKSSDVAHGITANTETDTFGAVRARSSNGTLRIAGFCEDVIGLELVGIHTNDNAVKSTSGLAAILINGQLKSGASVTGLGANANILAVQTDGTARFILDADGDSHQDVGTAWTNFDDHADVALLTALSVHVSSEADPIKGNFAQFLDYNRETLERLRLVTFNEDGHHFVNMSKLSMLLVGAVRQISGRMDALEQKLLLLTAA